MRLWVFLFSVAALAPAQPVSIGVRGGVPITDFFDTLHDVHGSAFTDTKRYLVGPTVEFHGPLGLSLEIDGLYRRLGYEYQVTSVDTLLAVRTVANSWQFPVLAKWSFLPGPVKPFLNAGVNVQHMIGVHQVRTLTVLPSHVTTTTTDNPNDLNHDTTVGFTFGGGVQLKLGRLRIEPEFRYTRWGTEAFRDPARLVLSTNLNQGDFVLGLTF